MTKMCLHHGSNSNCLLSLILFVFSVEELELRVTQMSGQLAKMMKKTLAYEQGLADVASSRDLDEVRDKIYNLQLIAGQLHWNESVVILT